MSSTFHSKHAEAYERMGSNATLNIAKVFMPDILPTITDSSYILDNACGTGLITTMIKAAHPKVHIKCTDLAAGMIDIVKARVKAEGWTKIEAEVLDVRDLKTLETGSFSHVVTNFGIHPTPDDPAGPEKAVREIWRVLKPGGVAVVTTWSERNFDLALERAAAAVRPDETPYSWNGNAEFKTGWWLMKHLEEAGFGNKVQVKGAEGRIEAKTLDELVGNMMFFKDMFLKGYSEDELKKAEKAIREELRRLPQYEETEKDVGVKMMAWISVAWK